MEVSSIGTYTDYLTKQNTKADELKNTLNKTDYSDADDEKLFAEAEKKLLAAYEIGDTKPAEEPLVYDRVTA